MYLLSILSMESRNKGLTVGELTMAIGALVLGALVWTSFSNNEEESSNVFLDSINSQAGLSKVIKSFKKA